MRAFFDRVDALDPSALALFALAAAVTILAEIGAICLVLRWLGDGPKVRS